MTFPITIEATETGLKITDAEGSVDNIDGFAIDVFTAGESVQISKYGNTIISCKYNQVNGGYSSAEELRAELVTLVAPFQNATGMKWQSDSFTLNPGGALRVAQLTTLFDGKILNADDTDIWSNAGTGTGAFENNAYSMSVTAGQYLVRQSRRYAPYFSGKPQSVEITCDNFQSQAGFTKRAGYFSSSAVAPYSATLDGLWLEDDGTTKRFMIYKAGTEIINSPISEWTNGSLFDGYNWQNFSVFIVDFLWLGGLVVRLWGAHPTLGIVFLNKWTQVGQRQGVIIKSPNQPLRYEIRASAQAVGTGVFKAICSQISTEGSVDESGKPLGIFNTTSLSCSVVGTIYAVKSIKKRADNRDISVKITSFGIVNTATSDAGILMLIVNPTLSAPIVYANKAQIAEGTPTNQTITAGTGRVLYAEPVSASGATTELTKDYLTWLSQSVDDTFDEYVLAYMPTTANQTLNGVINTKLFF